VTSTDKKPEVVFSRGGCHHISAVGASILTKFGSLMQNNVHISGKWSKSKVDFQYGERLFFKNDVVMSQPSIEICRQNLVCS